MPLAMPDARELSDEVLEALRLRAFRLDRLAPFGRDDGRAQERYSEVGR